MIWATRKNDTASRNPKQIFIYHNSTIPGSISHRHMSRLLPISAWVRVFPPRTKRQATGRVKLFLKCGLTEELILNSSWLCTRPFLSRERPAAGRVFAFNWWRGSCRVVLCCCFACKESSDRVMPLVFSYTSELKLNTGWFWRRLLSIDVTAVPSSTLRVRSLGKTLKPRPCRINLAITRSIRQGLGLRFSLKDRFLG